MQQAILLFGLFAVVFTAAQKNNDPLIAKYPELVTWFTSNGGVIDPRIKIGYDEKGIRGMIATDLIPMNTVIIDCPGDLVVKREGSASNDPCADIANVVEHLKAGEKSKWHAYFDFDDSIGSRIPSEWKEDSRPIDELQGLPPTGETHRHINWYKDTCKNGQEISEIELRAFKIFLTRAADIGLIPMYDLMNHHNGLINTYLQRADDGKGLKVISLTDIAPNEQIYNTYARSGWESSTEVFLTYGFVEDYPQLWQWSDEELDAKSEENENHHFSRYTRNEENEVEPNSMKYEVLVLGPDVAALYPTTKLTNILGNGQRSIEEWKSIIAEHHRMLRASRVRDMAQSIKDFLEVTLPTTIQEDEKILEREKYVFENVKKLGRVDLFKADVIQAIQYRLAFKKAMKLAADIAEAGEFVDDSDEL